MVIKLGIFMAKQLFTAADIRNLVNSKLSSFLVIGKDDIVTPEAMDIARDNGIELIRETQEVQLSSQITTEIRQNSEVSASLPPVKLILSSSVIMDPFGSDIAAPGTNVRLKDVVTSADGSSMAAGYMSLDKGVFPWKLTYDEVDIILEGNLIITRDNVSINGKPGDVIFIPKNSKITFSTDDRVRFIYVAYPSNWNDAQ